MRSAPTFAAAVTAISAGPLPEAGATDTQGASALAFQSQPGRVRTSRRAWPPAASSAADGAETLNSHAAASSLISARWSATAIAPRRTLGSAFAATRYDTVPSPCPLAPSVIVIHAALAVAVHAHSRDTLTASVPAPPAAAKLDGEELSVAWHREAVGPVTLVTAELPHASASVAAVSAGNSRARVFTAYAFQSAVQRQ